MSSYWMKFSKNIHFLWPFGLFVLSAEHNITKVDLLIFSWLLQTDLQHVEDKCLAAITCIKKQIKVYNLLSKKSNKPVSYFGFVLHRWLKLILCL